MAMAAISDFGSRAQKPKFRFKLRNATERERAAFARLDPSKYTFVGLKKKDKKKKR